MCGIGRVPGGIAGPGGVGGVGASGPAADSGAIRLRWTAFERNQVLREVAAGVRTLGLGERGPAIAALQDTLRALGFTRAASSGTFSRDTQNAVAAFQRAQRLAPSGEVDAATIGALDAARVARTRRPKEGPLDGKFYMDSTTFAGAAPFRWARDSFELEAVRGVRGMDPMALLDTLRATDANGRTTYQRLRRPEVCEAFCLGYDGMPIDEMKWDEASHALREKNKFVSVTIEGDRFDPDATTGVRRICVGTDKMDDVYYDTANFDLLRNGYSVRGRARWDTDTEIRRILIGVKAGTEIDEFGLKRTAKTDIRRDGATPEEIAGLDKAVRTGKTLWGGREETVAPLKGVYEGLNAKGLLPDIGTNQDVLLMDPKVHVRSVRSRYHLNETPLREVQRLYRECGAPRLNQTLELIASARAAGAVPSAEAAAVDALDAAARGLLDGSAIARAAEARLLALDPAMAPVTADSIRPFLPDAPPQNPRTFEAIEKRRVVAEAVDELYHTFARDLDGVRRTICQAQDRALEDYPDCFIAWQKSIDRALVNKGAVDPFVAKLDAILAKPAAEMEADLATFNTFGEAQRAAGVRAFRDFEPLTPDQLRALRAQLVNEQVRIAERQLEAVGSAARNLWFDEARQVYVPGSRRNTGNFLIDTTDLSEYVKHEDWESIPEAQRTPANTIPRDKIFHCTFVNELQIELGLEKPYIDRMDALKKAIDTDRASLVMKWMDAEARPGVVATDEATDRAAFAGLKALPDAELEAEVARLNDFLRAQGSGLRPVTAADVKRLDPALLTTATRDAAVRTTGETERNLDGARFVFEQYRNMQNIAAEAKGERFLGALRDAGAPAGITYDPTDASKGDLALRMLSAIP